MAEQPTEIKALVQKLIREFRDLEAERGTLDPWLNQIAHYVVPMYYDMKYRDKREQQKLPDDIYMDVARQANMTFAAGMMGYLTSPASRWFNLGVRDRKLKDIYEVRKYLEEVQDLIYDAFSFSNFYAEAKKVYKDLGAFGSANCYAELDERNIFHYSTFPVLTCYWITDSKNRVTGVMRTGQMTPLQVMERWGDAVPSSVKEALKSEKSEPLCVLHIVKPRAVFDATKKDKMNKRYAVYYILKDEDFLLEESGLDELRWTTARFDTVTGEKYGFSPAMYALGSIKMSNSAAKTTIEAFQLTTMPPLTGNKDLYPDGIDFSPRAFNPAMSSPNDPTDVLRPLQTGANPDAGLKILEWFVDWIKSAFFVDLFLALMDKTKRMSIPEVQELVAEKMLILGSGLENIMNDFLEPNIEMMYNELGRRGELPPLPEALKGKPLTIEYISPLAKAQKALQSGSIQNLMTIVANLMPAAPDIVDNFDTDEVARVLHAASDSPMRILRKEDDVKARREARVAAQAEAVRRENEAHEAEVDEMKSKAEANREKTGSRRFGSI